MAFINKLIGLKYRSKSNEKLEKEACSQRHDQVEQNKQVQ